MFVNVARRTLARNGRHALPIAPSILSQKRALSRTPITLDESRPTTSSPTTTPNSSQSTPTDKAANKKAAKGPSLEPTPKLVAATPETVQVNAGATDDASAPSFSTSIADDAVASIEAAAHQLKQQLPVLEAQQTSDPTPSSQTTPPSVPETSPLQSEASGSDSATKEVVNPLEVASSASQPTPVVALEPVEVAQSSKVGITPKPQVEVLQPLRPVIEDPEERFWHSQVVRGRSLLAPFRHPITHGVPVAVIHLRSYYPALFPWFCHFIEHAASSLGIPISGTVSLPKSKRLWTVIKSPFVYKKSQENFQRITHSRCIKAYDADPEVVDRWIKYIERHAQAGIGIRVVRWHRVPVGAGETQMKRVVDRFNKRLTSSEQVKELSQRIIAEEMKTIESAPSAP